MSVRKIIKIDEEKCDGCGLCVPDCAEGALQIIDGKARLVSDVFCDGLGACLGTCPQGAISMEEREAADFDEEAAMAHAHKEKEGSDSPNLACGCPSTLSKTIERSSHNPQVAVDTPSESALQNWPVQIKLVPPAAPYLAGADLLVAADCVPFSYAGFHNELLSGKTLLVGCPKLDDADYYVTKLTEIFANAHPASITVAKMEVPCCSGISQIVSKAVELSGISVPVSVITVSIEGKIIESDCPSGCGCKSN